GKYSRWSLPLDDIYQNRALPYLEHFIRHILFLRGRYFIVYDDLACSRPATYTWLYHILPQEPFNFDESTFTIDYAIGDVNVRLRHIAYPEGLELDDRVGMKAFVNPLTGEDYRRWRRGNILCGHNLWVNNAVPARQWRFLTVIYPVSSGETMPAIERLDDSTARVANEIISFDPDSTYAQDANLVVDTAAMAESLERDWE
ncbi:MAG: hypothetical protein JSW47_17285, partial [Phycisphaerales bacterium]